MSGSPITEPWSHFIAMTLSEDLKESVVDLIYSSDSVSAKNNSAGRSCLLTLWSDVIKTVSGKQYNDPRPWFYGRPWSEYSLSIDVCTTRYQNPVDNVQCESGLEEI